MDENQEQFLTLKEVRDMTGLSSDLIRTYEKEFNLNFDRTEGKHRRFTNEDVELLVAIKKRIKEQGWSYKQVFGWLHGTYKEISAEETTSSNLEKKVENLTEVIEALTNRLDDQEQYYRNLFHQQQRLLEEKSQEVNQEQISETVSDSLEKQQEMFKKELGDQRQYFEEKLEEKNNDVVNELRKLQAR